MAGVADYADVEAIREVADAVLSGVYQGDLAVALERAAAFFRVVAAGRRSGADDSTPDDSTADVSSQPARDLAARNERVADSLAAAAARWRAGTLR